MKAKILIPIAVIIAIGVELLFLFTTKVGQQVLPGSRPNSASTELVDIDWKAEKGGRLHMLIPRAYITGSIQEPGTTSISDIVLELGLSDLKPRPVETTGWARPGSAEWEKREKADKDGIWLHMKNGMKNTSVEYKGNVRRRLRGELDETHELYLRPSENGLIHYQGMTCSPVDADYRKPANDPAPGNCHSVGDELFVTAEDDDEWVMINCSSPLLGPAEGCTITRVLGGNFTFDFIIRRSELPRWKMFDQGVRRLISSFQVRDQLTP